MIYNQTDALAKLTRKYHYDSDLKRTSHVTSLKSDGRMLASRFEESNPSFTYVRFGDNNCKLDADVGVEFDVTVNNLRLYLRAYV